jgi:hypothetical protein
MKTQSSKILQDQRTADKDGHSITDIRKMRDICFFLVLLNALSA